MMPSEGVNRSQSLPPFQGSNDCCLSYQGLTPLATYCRPFGAPTPPSPRALVFSFSKLPLELTSTFPLSAMIHFKQKFIGRTQDAGGSTWQREGDTVSPSSS